MVECSNCESAVAILECNDCLNLNGNESLFCSECSGIHLKLKKFQGHSFQEIKSITGRDLCCNCESNAAEYKCFDCPVEEQKYCSTCAGLHCKVKSTRCHRICSYRDDQHEIVSQGSYRDDQHEKVSQDKSLFLDTCHSNLEKDTRSSSPFSSLLMNIPLRIKALYIYCSTSNYLNELVETLSYFDFPVSNDDLPSISIGISFVLLMILICVFYSQIGQVIRFNGSAIASIIGGIAFLRFVQNSKLRNYRHDTKLNHARQKKKENMKPFKACSGTSNSHIQARNKENKVI